MKIDSILADSARAATLASILILAAAAGHADETAKPKPPVPSRHQMMKDCMKKQKASDGGVPKDEMKRNCKDVTKTEQENAETEQREAEPTPTPPTT